MKINSHWKKSITCLLCLEMLLLQGCSTDNYLSGNAAVFRNVDHSLKSNERGSLGHIEVIGVNVVPKIEVQGGIGTKKALAAGILTGTVLVWYTLGITALVYAASVSSASDGVVIGIIGVGVVGGGVVAFASKETPEEIQKTKEGAARSIDESSLQSRLPATVAGRIGNESYYPL